MAELEASPRRDPHNWNSLDNYRFLHEKHLDAHPFVLPNGWDLTFHYTSLPFSQFDAIRLEGLVLCTNGLVLEMTKEGDVDRTQAYRVRMFRFRYNAHFPREKMSSATTTCTPTNPTSIIATSSTPSLVTRYPSVP